VVETRFVDMLTRAVFNVWTVSRVALLRGAFGGGHWRPPHNSNLTKRHYKNFELELSFSFPFMIPIMKPHK
jgi:hypothetical protein